MRGDEEGSRWINPRFRLAPAKDPRLPLPSVWESAVRGAGGAEAVTLIDLFDGAGVGGGGEAVMVQKRVDTVNDAAPLLDQAAIIHDGCLSTSSLSHAF